VRSGGGFPWPTENIGRLDNFSRKLQIILNPLVTTRAWLLLRMGYQPLIRQILTRFADCEKKKILRKEAARVMKQREESLPVEQDDAPRSGTHG
jgi:hypothetical protein